MIIFFSSNFNKIESVVIFVVWCFLLSICNFVCVCVCFWVRRIFLRCGSKSQKLLMSLEVTKLCGSFGPKVDKLLAGWKKILPQKGAFEGSAYQRYCSLWVAVFETCSDCMSLLPQRARLYHYNTCVILTYII